MGGHNGPPGSVSVSISHQSDPHEMERDHQGKLQYHDEHDPAFATKVTIHQSATMAGTAARPLVDGGGELAAA